MQQRRYYQGTHGRLKNVTLVKLDRYRKQHGPGCLSCLARAASVEEEDLRAMIERRKVELATWERVAKALGVDFKKGGDEA